MECVSKRIDNGRKKKTVNSRAKNDISYIKFVRFEIKIRQGTKINT